MSACSAFLVDAGALFTEGLYRPVLVRDREDRHYLWVGRISGFAITMLGVLYAVFLVQSVLYTFLLTETLATFMGIGVLGGLVWRRANRWGALASLLSALGANFLLYARTGQRLDHWDANVFLAALIVGILALVVVSLATPPNRQRASTRSSSGSKRRAMEDRPAAPQPLLLVNFLRPARAAAGRGWRAYREDSLGVRARLAARD